LLTLESRLAERDAALATLETTLAARDENLGQLDTTLQEREQRLAALESDLASRNTALAALEDDLAERDAAIAEREAELANRDGALAARESELAAVQATLATVDQERIALINSASQNATELAALRGARDDVLAELQEAQLELSAANRDLSALQSAQNLSAGTISQLQIDVDASEERLSSLRSDYGELKAKYDELVRPARSPKDKHVVLVRARMVNGTLERSVREQTGRYEVVSEDAMNTWLQARLDEHGDNLYVSIVYPENSGLSYDVAFQFSQDVLTKYDYYHREWATSQSGSGIARRLDLQPEGNGTIVLQRDSHVGTELSGLDTRTARASLCHSHIEQRFTY